MSLVSISFYDSFIVSFRLYLLIVHVIICSSKCVLEIKSWKTRKTKTVCHRRIVFIPKGQIFVRVNGIILSQHVFEENCFVKYPFRIVLLIVLFSAEIRLM